jgi:RNA polymerase sigma factor (sigma-70 family)
MRLAVQHPACLFGVDANRQQTGHGEEAMLFIFHATPDRLFARTEQDFSKTVRKRLCDRARTAHHLPHMSDLIKLVKTYRLTRGLAERLDLAERIVPLIERDLRFFVFAALRPPVAEDVFQVVLVTVVKNLGQFKGDTSKQFWGWCYTIARSKIANAFQYQKNDRLQFMPEEELWQVIESAMTPSAMSAADRLDLQHSLKMLARVKPDCDQYLREYYIIGLDYAEIAAQRQATPDSVRMRINRCLDEAQKLMQ